MSTHVHSRVTALIVMLSALSACAASPTTFVLTQVQRGSGFDSYQVRFTPLADDPALSPDLKETFELGLLSGLEETGMKGRTGDTADDRTLVILYRAAGLSEGSLAARAGTAAVNAILPVGVVPEVGSGDLGIESTFLDSQGVVMGEILVQSDVRGIFRTDSGTMRRIGARTAEFVGSRFARTAPPGPLPALDEAAGRNVVNLTPELARAELAVFEPLIGEWELTYEFRVPGTATTFAKAHESNRWEAGGRVFLQYAETNERPVRRFRYNLILWDPVAKGIAITALDSIFGAHTSHQVTIERDGNVLKGVANEPERVTEFTETLSDDGKTRRGSKFIWSADRSRLLLTVLLEGTRQDPAKR